MSEQSDTNWKQVFVTVTLTAFFTVVAGLVTYYLTTKSLKLTYAVARGPAIESPAVARGPAVESPAVFKTIYVFTVSNSGNTEVETVTFSTALPVGQIEEARLRTDLAMSSTESRSGNQYRVTLDTLNPGEEFSVALMISTPSEDDELEVGLRAKGVIGEKAEPRKSTGRDIALPIIVGSLATMLAVFTSVNPALRKIILRRAGTPMLVKALSRGSNVGPFRRNEIVAYVLAATGLFKEARQVRFAPSESSFQGASDFIASLANEDEAKRPKCSVALKGLLLIDNMWPESQKLIKRNLKMLEGEAYDENSIEQISSEAIDVEDNPAELRDSIDQLIVRLLTPPSPLNNT